VIALKVPGEIVKQLDALAAANYTSRSAVARLMLARGVAECEPKAAPVAIGA
jgi:hypothetical protein